jgi:hypothetical protein
VFVSVRLAISRPRSTTSPPNWCACSRRARNRRQPKQRLTISESAQLRSGNKLSVAESSSACKFVLAGGCKIVRPRLIKPHSSVVTPVVPDGARIGFVLQKQTWSTSRSRQSPRRHGHILTLSIPFPLMKLVCYAPVQLITSQRRAGDKAFTSVASDLYVPARLDLRGFRRREHFVRIFHSIVFAKMIKLPHRKFSPAQRPPRVAIQRP